MEKSQTEVTENIRHAIKEKLKKMNSFVDDELPDYIMILIANKRSKHHMEKDLSLFLGNQTVGFTNWLWDLIIAFKGGAKIKSSKSQLVLDSQSIENFQTKDTRADEDDVLNYDPAEEGESLCIEETNQSSEANDQLNIFKDSEKCDDSKDSFFSDDEATANSYLLLSAADKSQQKVAIKVEKNEADTAQVKSPKSLSGGQKSAKVYPIQRMKPVPNAVLQRESVVASSRVEKSSKPEYSVIPSVVCFTQKKFGGATAALQANKLLLRAVNDATKSVLSGRSINDYYKPTPIKELAESKRNSIEKSENKHTGSNAIESSINEQKGNLVKYEIQPNNISSENSEQVTQRQIIGLNPEVNMFEKSNIYASVHQPQVQSKEESIMTPHFIVTLDGVNFSSLKRKRSVVTDEEPMDIEEEEETFSDDGIEQIGEKKLKLAERCKYWPACKNNVECAYHHPTVPCKCFPNCKFGDKCLYIHPNCKFDALCSKRDCPYTHCSVRKYPVATTATTKIPKFQKSKIVCKYYPRCTAKPCPFIHPKSCKFGTQCRAPRCPFGHFQIPNRNQLKWKAV